MAAAIKNSYKPYHSTQGDPSGRLKPPVDFGFGSSGSWWAPTVATYLPFCPAKMTELSQREVLTDQMSHPVVVIIHLKPNYL